MSNEVPPAALDAPYLATPPDSIEQLLSASTKPLDTICGLLATDPAILLHLLRHFSQSDSLSDSQFGLRYLAGVWMRATDHRWYNSILAVRHSALSKQQRDEHRKLCSRATIAAGLIGEWVSDDLPCVRENPELQETRAVMAVLPSLLQLCRIQDGHCYASVPEERSAWFKEIRPFVGEAIAKALQPSVESSEPANVAVEMAAACVSDKAQDILVRKLPEWARRLDRDTDALQQDLSRVTHALELVADAHIKLEPHEALSLVQGSHASEEGSDSDCEGCRQRAYENALSTVRNRLAHSTVTLSEAVDHLMHALCNCGSLRRAQWYVLDDNRQALQSKRRKSALKSEPLDASELAISVMPILQVLLERPRSIQVNPEINVQLGELLPSDTESSFEQHYLCASIFCGSSPLGIFYADADGGSIGAAEAAKFKAVAQLATKVATLLALRNHKTPDMPNTSQMAYPDYASFEFNVAANERESITSRPSIRRDSGAR